MKHEVGDVVKVREDLKKGGDFGRLCVSNKMAEFAGKLVTISSVNYLIEEDGETYYWIDEFFEDEDKECDVDKIIKEEEKSDEYDDIIDEVLSEMTEETKDKLIKEFAKGKNNITIIATPIYEMTSHTNGISIQRIVGTKYGVAIVSGEEMVKL